jgi:peptidoglycan/LPS O-acetylase OafA/YrhL
MSKHLRYSRRKHRAALVAVGSALCLLALLLVSEVMGDNHYGKLMVSFLAPFFIVVGIGGTAMCYYQGTKEQQALFSRFVEPFRPAGDRKRTTSPLSGKDKRRSAGQLAAESPSLPGA